MNLKDYLTYYLLYVFNYKLNYIPEWMIFENWNKRVLENINEMDEGYAFEIYY